MVVGANNHYNTSPWCSADYREQCGDYSIHLYVVLNQFSNHDKREECNYFAYYGHRIHPDFRNFSLVCVFVYIFNHWIYWNLLIISEFKTMLAMAETW